MTPFHKTKSAMILIDTHTHNSTPTEHSIYNSGTSYIAARNISVGIHPWNISSKWEEDFADITKYAMYDNVKAIGECGLDTIKSQASLKLQEEIFSAHAQLAESAKKPLIIHCVKAFDTLLAIRKEINPQQAWIIHGFRGKPEQSKQLIKAGFFISLGEKYNPDSARAIPLERLLIESDESSLPIDKIYDSVANIKSISIEALVLQIETNAQIFGQF